MAAFEIIPSIASANPLCLCRELERLQDIPRLHIDIEDGNFVPNISFGMKTVAAIAAATDKTMDAHLMVTNPRDYLQPLAALGVKAVCVHVESEMYPLLAIGDIHRYGMQAGLALNFKSDWEDVRPFISDMDYVLIMCAEPDGKGECFHPNALDKVRRFAKQLPPDVAIWVDGGVDANTIQSLVLAGASVAIIGRALFKTDDVKKTYTKLMRFTQYI